jgi:alpha-beta hydrolase superfamily lysophospholipase
MKWILDIIVDPLRDGYDGVVERIVDSFLLGFSMGGLLVLAYIKLLLILGGS